MTPYEIRLDLLKMAREMLEIDYHSQKQKLIDEWHMNASKAMEEKLKLPSHPTLPAFPSEDQIIEKAKKLNSFVSNG